MAPLDRRALLLDPRSPFNGIDFVEIADDTQTALRIHFFNDRPLAGTISVMITGGERNASVAIDPIDPKTWTDPPVGSHRVVDFTVAASGDFSSYTLTVSSTDSDSGLDPYFASSVFSFKARCPSDLDCQAPPVACPAPGADAPPIDYQAKDFASFRQALLDFSALRYPEWQERSEADFGVMFMEALCALADDLSYTQDRIAAESALETATQRRSVVRLARLVDYEPRPATVARVLLQFDVAPGTKSIPSGTIVSARGPDGETIQFEAGSGITTWKRESNTLPPVPPMLDVSAAFNSGIKPYWFDDRDRCLRAGATQMYVRGGGFKFKKGQRVLNETERESSADPSIRQIVVLDEDGQELCDPLIPPSRDIKPLPPVLACPKHPCGTAVTLLHWRPEDKLLADRDLTETKLAGNLIEATQGATQPTESFVIPPSSQRDLPEALVRTGANDTLQYLYSLGAGRLAWLAQENGVGPPQPEIILTATAPNDAPSAWKFLPSLLTARPFDNAFTIDPVRYSRIAGNTVDTSYFDYDGDNGDTLRFGDGVFGTKLSEETRFTAFYRVGGGAIGNVAADSITQIDPRARGVTAVTNPLPASGGADAEPLERVRRLAPQAFRELQFRAVVPKDYATAAETLPWVQRAGSVFRWTGSWLTAFTTPDPLHSEQISVDRRIELVELLNRYRMAGYESYVPDPKYVSLDLAIDVCAQADVFRSDVETALDIALGTGPGGFFNPDRFTFAQPLELSELVAAIQRVYGVAGVLSVRFRVRGRTSGFTRLTDTLNVGVDEIIRCDNDPNLPNRGILKVTVEGGK
jgi:hypothetical protein